MRPFRFSFQHRDCKPAELIHDAKRAEAAGFDVFSGSDHVGRGWAPLAPLMAAAMATTTIRVSSLVINNDLMHPGLLAREFLAIDQLSGGRVELGIGAGHTPQEYEQLGLTRDSGATRKARLREAVEILRPLLAGEIASLDGEYYQVTDLELQKPFDLPIPLLVAASGPAARTHAAATADIIGLTGLGRTLSDGHRHAVHWQAERLDAEVGLIVEAAAAAGRETPELNALVQVVDITNERDQALAVLADRVPGLSVEDAKTTPYLAVGTHDEIAATFLAARERWGINYFSVRSIDEFAPVIERLRAYDKANV